MWCYPCDVNIYFDVFKAFKILVLEQVESWVQLGLSERLKLKSIWIFGKKSNTQQWPLGSLKMVVDLYCPDIPLSLMSILNSPSVGWSMQFCTYDHIANQKRSKLPTIFVDCYAGSDLRRRHCDYQYYIFRWFALLPGGSR